MRVTSRVALAFAVALALVGAAASAPATDRRPPLVRVATTGNGSERVDTLPITRRPGARERVVISMRPPRLPSLAVGDRVRVTAEVQMTGNCGHRDPRCRGPIYRYAPSLRARLVLARDPRATSGPGTLQIAAPEQETCTQKRPDYEHHCVLVFTAGGFEVQDPGRLPCPLEACFINLVASADNPRAGHGDLVTVGGLRPDGSIPQDRGRINVIRYRGATAGDFSAVSTARPHKRRLAPDLRRRVAFSRRLVGLRAGEQLAVDAALRTDVSRLRYAVRTSARLILADSPRATRQSALVKHVALLQGEISENNGSNCTQDEGICTGRKVGVLEIRRDAVSAGGRPVALYVNLVTVLGPKVLKARPGDRVILRGGGIAVTRFPPRLRG